MNFMDMIMGAGKNKVPIKFDSMKADSFIYSCIVKG